MELNKEQMIEYSRQIKEVNELRSKDYQDFKSLLLNWIGFINGSLQSEKNYINLWAINSFIEDFELKVIQSIGERRTSAENHLKTLYDIHSQYGKFYFESIVYREKIQSQQKDILVMSKKIAELTKELQVQKEMNKF